MLIGIAVIGALAVLASGAVLGFRLRGIVSTWCPRCGSARICLRCAEAATKTGEPAVRPAAASSGGAVARVGNRDGTAGRTGRAGAPLRPTRQR